MTETRSEGACHSCMESSGVRAGEDMDRADGVGRSLVIPATVDVGKCQWNRI